MEGQKLSREETHVYIAGTLDSELLPTENCDCMRLMVCVLDGGYMSCDQNIVR